MMSGADPARVRSVFFGQIVSSTFALVNSNETVICGAGELHSPSSLSTLSFPLTPIFSPLNHSSIYNIGHIYPKN